MTDSARHATFMRLVRRAFDEFADTEPLAVTSALGSSPQLNHEWQSRAGASPTELANIVSSSLSAGPVFLVPSWERLSPTPVNPLRNAYEVTVTAIPPSGPDSLLVAVLPAAALISPGSRSFREQVHQLWRPVLVIYAVGVLPSMHDSLDTAAVFWRPRPSGPHALRLFRLPQHEDEQAVEKDFRALLGQRSGKGAFGYILPGPPVPGESLSIELRDPATTERWSELGVWGTMTPLGDLFEIRAPGLHQSADRHLLHDKRREGSVRVLLGRDIRRDGTLAGPDESSLWADVPRDRQLQAGDIVLRRFFSPQVRGNLAVGEVAADDLPLAADSAIVTLRAVSHLKAPQRLMALLFLRSSLMRSYAVASGQATISPSFLRDVIVPQPDRALAATLDGLGGARSRLEEWQKESEALLNSVFEDESAVVARRRILESGRRLRMRVDAAALLDDFSHEVRTRYPHPIAYRWSEVQVQLSNGTRETAYPAILETAEVLLCYSALAVLALAHEAGRRVGALDDIRKRLTSTAAAIC